MADEIRLAASVIAGRDGSGGLELLVIERSRSSRFLPGYVAFPGGATDGGDAALALEWFGTEDEISRACGAGSDCGACQHLLAALIEDARSAVCAQGERT